MIVFTYFRPFAFTVILAVPFFMAVSLPALSIDSTFLLEELNVTFRFVAWYGVVLTDNNIALPAFSELGAFLSVSVFRGIAFVATFTVIASFSPFRAVAVILALPAFFALILPVLAFTVAMLGLLLLHAAGNGDRPAAFTSAAANSRRCVSAYRTEGSVA
jgi:hypothetical protein